MIGKIFNSISKGRLIRDTIKHIRIKKCINDNSLGDKEYLEKLGSLKLGYKFNLDNPTTFNEKLNWYKINYYDELMSIVVDKSQAKKYVESKGLDNILIKTIGIYNSLDDVDLDNLPNSFVIKNTSDSGGVFICHDKTKIDKKMIIDKLTDAQTFNFKNGKHIFRENIYNKFPNKVIVEELLNTDDGHSPNDYKFFCFNGEPKFLFVATERDVEVKFDYFDIDFNWIDVSQIHKHNKIRPHKPKNYDRMLEICKILSKDFPHVRVDLYNIDGEIYFGELTFYHDAGLTPFVPREWDYKFGDLFDISSIKKL